MQWNDRPSQTRRAALGVDGHLRAGSSLSFDQTPIRRRVVRMTPIETVRRLLVHAPGIAVCDSCLAHGCSTSVREIREITAALLNSAGFHRHDRCWGCRRNVDATVYRAKCVHCEVPIESDHDAVGFGQDLFHPECLRAVRASRKRQRAPGRLTDETRRQTRTQRRASG